MVITVHSMFSLNVDGERGRGNQEGRGGTRGREEEQGITTFQVHSNSRQDLHFNTHKLTALAKDSCKNYLREWKIKLTV